MPTPYDDLHSRIPQLIPHEMRTLNRYYLHPQNKRCCAICHQIKHPIREHFSVAKYYPNGGFTWDKRCKLCKNAHNREQNLKYRKDAAQFIRTKFPSYRCRALEQDLAFNLTAEYLIKQWEKQQGLCFYTAQKIDFNNVSPNRNSPHHLTPSLDKMDPKKGYIIGNVVWCAHRINTMKNDHTYDQFIEMCGHIFKLRSEIDEILGGNRP